jgi:hypothetical protein
VAKKIGAPLAGRAARTAYGSARNSGESGSNDSSTGQSCTLSVVVIAHLLRDPCPALTA